MQNKKYLYILILICLMEAMVPVASRYCLNTLPTLFFVGLKGVVMFFVTSFFISFRKSLKWQNIFMGLIISGSYFINYLAISHISPSLVSIITYFPFSVILAWIILGESLSKLKIFGLIISFSGIVIISGDMSVANLGYMALTMFASAMAGYSLIFIKKWKLQGPEVVSISSMFLAFCLPLSFLVNNITAMNAINNPATFTIMLVSAFVYVGAFSVFKNIFVFKLVQELPVHIVSVALLTVPAICVLYERVFLGIYITHQQMFGAGIVLFGVWLVEKKFKHHHIALRHNIKHL